VVHELSIEVDLIADHPAIQDGRVEGSSIAVDQREAPADQAPSRARTRGTAAGMACCATACVLVGTSFSAAHILSQYPYPMGQALRYGLAAIVLGCMVFAGKGADRERKALRELGMRAWLRLIALAATGAVGFNLAILAAERTAAPAVPGVVVGCSPLVVAILAPLLARRRPRPRIVAAAVLVASGAAVVQGFGHSGGGALAYSVLALGGEVSFSLLAVPLLGVISPMLLSACICAAATLEAAAVGLAAQGTAAWRTPDAAQAAAILWQALAVTVLAFWWWYTGLRRLGPERAQLFVGLMPVAAAVSAPVLGAGGLGPAQIGGSLLVAAGVVAGSVHTARRTARNQAFSATGRAGSRRPGSAR
jgi:drug/metabolite transporter (DMT)-like permease